MTSLNTAVAAIVVLVVSSGILANPSLYLTAASFDNMFAKTQQRVLATLGVASSVTGALAADASKCKAEVGSLEFYC